jgi:hypothetical protein
MNNNTVTYLDALLAEMDETIEFSRGGNLNQLAVLRAENENLRNQLEIVRHDLRSTKLLNDLMDERIHELDDQLDAMFKEKMELKAKLEKNKKKRKLEQWLQQTMEEYQEFEQAQADGMLDDTEEVKRLKVAYREREF